MVDGVKVAVVPAGFKFMAPVVEAVVFEYH
jgi:hypothetical protein